MRSLGIILLFLFILPGKSFGLDDDSLPKGKSSRFLVFPFAIRSPETSWGFGGASAYFFKAKKNEDQLRTSDINIIGLYTLRKQVVIVLGSTVFFPGEKKIFRLQSSFSYYPDKFWGIGNSTLENAKEDYSLKQAFINPQFIIKFYRKLFAGVTFELQNVTDFTYSRGGIFDSENVKGKNGGLTAGAGLLFTWDTRNNAYSPSRGIFSEINITRFDRKLGSDFNFTCYSLDIRKFTAVGRNRVFAAQSFTRLNHGNASVRYLSMLGGAEMMRGYYKGRYMDQNMTTIQGELRQYLFWRLGVAAFAAAGQVSKSVENFSLQDFHFAYGGGLRLMVHEKEKLNLRIDFGFGKGSSGVYVILKEAF